MKKLYTILMAAMMFTASYAQQARPAQQGGRHQQRFIKLPDGVTDVRSQGLASLKSSLKANAPKREAGSYDVSGLELISEQPEGTVTEMIKTSTYYATSYGYAYYSSNDGSQTFFVEGNDGYYYISSPFYGWPTDTWLRLEKEGDEYVAKLPQAIYHVDATDDYEEATYYAFAMNLTTWWEDYTEYYKCEPSATQEYRFVMQGDTIVSKDANLLLALCDADGTWYYYGDKDWTLTKFAEKPVEVSDEIAANAMTFALKYTDYSDSQFGYIVSGAFDGNGHVYVKGAFASLPDAWVEGTFDGQKAVFPSGQYMGFNESWQSYSYFMGATYGEVYDEYYDEYYDDFIITDSIAFDVDMNTLTMTTDGHYLLNCSNSTTLNPIESIMSPEISLWTEKAGTPQDPEFIDFGEYDDYYGSSISTYLPIFDTDGYLMDYRKMTYSFYIDDEVFEVSDDYGYTDIYGNPIEPATVLPYDYHVYDALGNAIFYDGGMHFIYLYVDGYDKFGVQTTYNGGGETHSSNIVYHYVNGDPSSVSGIHADTTSVSYTDLSGRSVKNPAHGLYIKTTTLTDGTVKSTKVIRR